MADQVGGYGLWEEFDDGDNEDDWELATEENLNAWCNLGNCDWDAYIIEI